MAKWFVRPDEAFVFRERHGDEAVIILRQGAQHPPEQVEIDGYPYDFDEDKTEQVRMFMRVADRKRLEREADTG